MVFLICTAEFIPVSVTLDWTMERLGKGYQHKGTPEMRNGKPQ